MTPPEDVADPVFRGIGVALVTLFDQDGTLLSAETAQLAAQVVADGAAAVLIGGTTGEFWTLTTAERITLTQDVRAAMPRDIPVLLNVGATREPASFEAAAATADSGAEAVLCLTPPGSDAGVFFPRIRELIGDLPLLAYHFPRAGFAPIPLDTLAVVDGTKDSSGDSERLVQTPALPAGVYTGSPLLLGLAGATGIPGAILALANVDAAAAQAAFGGDRTAQRRMAQLHRSTLGEPPPRAVKRLVAERYGTPMATRPETLRDAFSAVA